MPLNTVMSNNNSYDNRDDDVMMVMTTTLTIGQQPWPILFPGWQILHGWGAICFLFPLERGLWQAIRPSAPGSLSHRGREGQVRFLAAEVTSSPCGLD